MKLNLMNLGPLTLKLDCEIKNPRTDRILDIRHLRDTYMSSYVNAVVVRVHFSLQDEHQVGSVYL